MKKHSRSFWGNGVQGLKVRKILKQKNGSFKVKSYSFNSNSDAKYFNLLSSYRKQTKK